MNDKNSKSYINPFKAMIYSFLLINSISALLALFLGLALFSLLSFFSTLVVFLLAFIIFRTINKHSFQKTKEINVLKATLTQKDALNLKIIPILEYLLSIEESLVSATHSGLKSIREQVAGGDQIAALSKLNISSIDSKNLLLSKIEAFKNLDSAAQGLKEIELRLPFVSTLHNRVIAHTEQAALVLIESFGKVSQSTSVAAKDAKRAMESLNPSNSTETGLDTLIKKSHDSVVGRTEVIHSFLRLNRENADRVRKISALVIKTEEMISGIEDITERSKLITFNLAVESAKIGEKGYGFKVIVHELQNLNDQTTTFARNILELVKSFQGYNQELLDEWISKSDSLTEQVRSDSDNAEKALSALAQAYELSGSLFRSLSDNAISVNNSMGDILQSLQFQDITRQQIECADAFLSDILKSVKVLHPVMEAVGCETKNVASMFKEIRTTYTPKIKVSSDLDIFDLVEGSHQ
ncbi:hypothetical protein MASR2M78_11120 [Treponema sp.]